MYRHTAGPQGNGHDAGTDANLEHRARRQPRRQVGGDTLAPLAASATFVVLLGDPVEVERDARIHAGTLTHDGQSARLHIRDYAVLRVGSGRCPLMPNQRTRSCRGGCSDCPLPVESQRGKAPI